MLALAVFAWVFGIAAVLVIGAGPLVYHASSYDGDFGLARWIAVWVWTLTAVAAVVTGICLYTQAHPDHSADDCANRGGVWSVIGHHTVPTTTLVGKVPVTTYREVKDYGCVTVIPR